MNRHSSSSIRTEEQKNVVYMMTERNLEINLFGSEGLFYEHYDKQRMLIVSESLTVHSDCLHHPNA